MKTIVENRWAKVIDGKKVICKVLFTFSDGGKTPTVDIMGYNPFPFFFHNSLHLSTSTGVFDRWMRDNGWEKMLKVTGTFSLNRIKI